MSQPTIAYAGNVFEAKCFESRESLQLFQPLVRNLGASEVQPLELRELFETFQSLVGDLGSAQFQHFEIGQSFDVHDAIVRYRGILEDQSLDPAQSFEWFQAGVNDFGVAEIHRNHLIRALRVHFDLASQLLDLGNGALLVQLAVLSLQRRYGEFQGKYCQGH